jgi:hypothetical protein
MLTSEVGSERGVRVELDPAWAREAAAWLQAGPDGLGVAAWPLVLTRALPPELADVGGGLLERYRSVRWHRPPPATFQAHARITVGEGASSVVVDLVAEADGDELASTRLVLGSPGAAEAGDDGAPPHPPMPEPPAWRTSWGFTTREDDLDLCTRLVGRSLPVIDLATVARQMGYVNRLVPGLIQLYLLAYPPRRWPGEATMESWYRHPLPVGALVEILRGPRGSHLSGLRVAGRDEAVSLLRFVGR